MTKTEGVADFVADQISDQRADEPFGDAVERVGLVGVAVLGILGRIIIALGPIATRAAGTILRRHHLIIDLVDQAQAFEAHAGEGHVHRQTVRRHALVLTALEPL